MSRFYSKVKERIIRVDHAGELGAVRIYEGQLSALKSHDKTQNNIIKEMLEGEIKHLDFFNEQLTVTSSRPSLLSPLWNVAGYFLGKVSSKLGTSYAHKCTEKVEEIIESHYQDQIEFLELTNQDKELVTNIKKFREEELEHKKIAEEHTKESRPLSIFGKAIKLLCGKSIWIAERF